MKPGKIGCFNDMIINSLDNPLSPVIILGMHRSGTSMIARMLHKLGLFMGNDLEINHESRFFLQCNEWLLRQASAAWDNPGAIRWLLSSEDLLKLVEDYLRFRLGHWPVHRYLGLARYLRGDRLLGGMRQSWGWKDPRNTFTLSIWLRLFPEAKVVHVYRNGVSVSASLHARGGRGIARARHRYERRQKWGLYRWLAKRNGFIYTVRCLDFMSAFSLWEEYVDSAFRVLGACDIPVFTIKYEEFVSDPLRNLQELAFFCGLNPEPALVEKVAVCADRDRIQKFKSSPDLLEFYGKVKNRKWMKDLGY